MTSRWSELSAARSIERGRPDLVLAFPVLDRGPGSRERDVFVLDVLGENLSGVEVLDDLAADHRGEHEYANRRVRSVDDLMRTVLAPRKADDVTLLQHLLTFGRAQRRPAPEHDHPFLVQVVRVVGPEPAARLDLGHRRADQLAADVLADERALRAPALAVPRPVPLVAVEVESLHPVDVSLRSRDIPCSHTRATLRKDDKTHLSGGFRQ